MYLNNAFFDLLAGWGAWARKLMYFFLLKCLVTKTGKELLFVTDFQGNW